MRFAIALLLLAPCLQAQSQFVFVAEQNQTTTLESFSLNPATGVLTANPGNPFPERQSPTAVAVSPNSRWLFVANGPDNNVSVFGISATGSLTEVAASPFSASDGLDPTNLVVSADSKFLFVANGQSVTDANSGLLDEYAIGSDGTLSAVAAYEIPVDPVGIFLHPLGKWLYVYGKFSGSYITAQVAGFTIGSDGLLVPGASPLTTVTTGDNPTALAGDANFLFVAGGTEGMFIDTYQISPIDGSIALLSEFTSAGQSQDMVVDSSGRFLFSNSSTFSITSGVLTVLQTNNVLSVPIFASLVNPLLFEGSPSDAPPFLLNSYQIQAEGTLAVASGSPYSLAGIPMAIVETGAAPVPTNPTIAFVPTSNTFPTPIPTNQSTQGSVGLYNEGYGNLDITSISISGSSDFAETNNCPTSLASGTGCLVSLTFSPTAIGVITASLNLVSNLPNASVPLSGTGVAPYPIPSMSPSTVSFGNTVLGQNSSQTVTVTNLSSASASLQISSIVIAGANPGDFSETNNCTASVPIGGSCSVSVTFAPQALGDRAATLLIATNAYGGTFAIPLTGEGVTALPQYMLATSVVGSGSIQQTPTGTSFAANTAITLTAVPGTNFTFSNWTGVCPGSTVLICTFAITGNTTAVATFTATAPPKSYTLSIAASGPGSIVQNPTGMSFAAGTSITLTAVPDTGDSFTGWSGACSGATLVCVLTLSANASVVGTFAATPPPVTPSITITPSKFSGNAGQTFTGQIVATGFSGTPKLSASCSIPMGACSVSGSTLTITTTAASAAVVTSRPILPWVLPLGVLIVFVLGVPKQRKLALCLGTLAFCAACGSSPKSVTVTPTPVGSSTPAGSYSVVIAAMGSTVNATANLTVTQ